MADLLEEDDTQIDTDVPGGSAGEDLLLPVQEKTYLEMSELGAKQFAVIVGVALLAGGLYMCMIGVDMLMEWGEEVWYTYIGKKKQKDPEDPAALVGSFKRYK